MTDRASQALARGVPEGVPPSFRASADHGDVSCSTLRARKQGRRSIEEKAVSQQYLYPWEEAAVVDFVLRMSDLGHPVRIKWIPELAFTVTASRPEKDRPLKSPGKNWTNVVSD